MSNTTNTSFLTQHTHDVQIHTGEFRFLYKKLVFVNEYESVRVLKWAGVHSH